MFISQIKLIIFPWTICTGENIIQVIVFCLEICHCSLVWAIAKSVFHQSTSHVSLHFISMKNCGKFTTWMFNINCNATLNSCFRCSNFLKYVVALQILIEQIWYYWSGMQKQNFEFQEKVCKLFIRFSIQLTRMIQYRSSCQKKFDSEELSFTHIALISWEMQVDTHLIYLFVK